MNNYTELLNNEENRLADRISLVLTPIFFVIFFYLFDMQINSKLISSGVLFYLSYLIYLKWRNFLHDIEIVDRHIAIDYKEFIAAYMGFVPWNQYKKRVRNIDLSTILILCAVVILFAVNKTNATFYNASFWLIGPVPRKECHL